MRHQALLILFICIASSALAQKASTRSINKLYYAKLYSQAIPKYEAALKKDSADAEVLGNLADCYRLTNNTKGQIICYNKLTQTGKADENQKINYAQALMSAGRYDEAKKILDDCKSDKRAESFLKSLSKLESFSKNADAYKLNPVPFNTKFNDFSAVTYLNDNVVFISNETKAAWISKKHGWTDQQYCDVYSVSLSADGKFGEKTLFMKELNSPLNDGPLCFSEDGKTVFYTRNDNDTKSKAVDGTQKLKIYQATIGDGKLNNVMLLKINSNEFNCTHPALSKDGKTLYFSSDMGGGFGGMDIWYCNLGADGAWSAPINLGEKINTPGNEVFSTTAKNNLLYFASNGHEGIGGLDIYEVKITDNKPGRVYNMGKPINSEFDDFSYHLYSDDKKALISTNRQNGGMDDDIYNVDVLRKVSRGKILNLKVDNNDTKEAIAGTKIILNNDTLVANEKGEIQTVLEEDVTYYLSINDEKYFNLNDTLITNTFEDVEEINKTVSLDEKTNLSLFAGIYDAKTGVGIEGVKITFKDLLTSKDFMLIKTQKNGEYKKLLQGKKVGDKLSYQVTIEKEGFLTKTINFNYDIKKEGEIQLNELLSLTIGKVEVGMDLAKMIDLKPIYFDVAKSIIRDDAAIELDKIVTVMKEFPNMTIELGAHTDCRGSASANLKLSDARAKASAAYVVKNGISASRITGVGYGEGKLLNSCGCEGKTKSTCTEDEHGKNRRTEFIILTIN